MRRLGAAAALACVLTLAGAAHSATPRFAALPSPIAPLSASPPLGGGASATTEGFRHRVDATTQVDVQIDAAGKPFSIHATQRLDVRVTGDYFFTIGAPLLDVEAAPGSASTPGLRTGAIIWAGFNPKRRLLAARATLDTAAAARSLPLRVEVANGKTTLVNDTAVTVGAYEADALSASLFRYLANLRRDVLLGRVPTSGGVYLTSPPRQTTLRIAAPLRITGTVGRRTVDELLMSGRLTVPATGAVRLAVTPTASEAVYNRVLPSGAELLRVATFESLTVARVRQYQTFLGNPDPSGRSETSFQYRTAPRPQATAAVATADESRSHAGTVAILAALLALAALGVVAWARS
jgi:hypothetical protein